MAGAGKRTFVAGEVLTAAQVNDYLMDQAVMRFSGSAARAASITAPTEGMVTYLDDINRVQVYDGAKWETVIDEGIVTAKGDLLVASASNSITRLGVGADNEILTASAGAPLGIVWAPAPGGDMILRHTVTSTGSVAIPADVPFVYAIVAAGGGSGTRGDTSTGNAGGGGGGGAVVHGYVPSASAVTVGAGGAAGTSTSQGNSGGNSFYSTLFAGGGMGAERGVNVNQELGSTQAAYWMALTTDSSRRMTTGSGAGGSSYSELGTFDLNGSIGGRSVVPGGNPAQTDAAVTAGGGAGGSTTSATSQTAGKGYGTGGGGGGGRDTTRVGSSGGTGRGGAGGTAGAGSGSDGGGGGGGGAGVTGAGNNGAAAVTTTGGAGGAGGTGGGGGGGGGRGNATGGNGGAGGNGVVLIYY